jgi:hypothetical protein
VQYNIIVQKALRTAIAQAILNTTFRYSQTRRIAVMRKWLFVCLILTQFARAAAFAAVAGVSCCANETSPACSPTHVAKLVGAGLVAQLELLTKLASLACTITENKAPAPVPAKTPVPFNHTFSEIIVPASGPILAKSAAGLPQVAILSNQTIMSQVTCRVICINDPPGIERTLNRLFALARGGLDGGSASIFSYAKISNPQSQPDWGFSFKNSLNPSLTKEGSVRKQEAKTSGAAVPLFAKEGVGGVRGLQQE